MVTKAARVKKATVLKFARSPLDGAVAKKKTAIAPSAIKKAMMVKLFIFPP